MFEFEWDATKAERNLAKHGVTFVEGATVFDDPNSLTGADAEHSIGEHRWVTFGYSAAGRLLAVFHAEYGRKIRLISVRVATRTERKIYESS
jgi:uncharacterized DUF497 family protein